ncbi:MAG: PAS domain S-box protein [Kiritimatiellae bacterium]|nr:PAS domain S-box protein [Kiritimatiellia bacterium]
MSVKKQSATTIRIDLLPDLHENPRKKKKFVVSAPAKTKLRMSREGVSPAAGWSRDFQELFRSVYDGAVITDLKGRILEANERALNFFGYGEQDLFGLNVLDLVSCADELLLDTILATLQDQKYVLINAYCLRQDESVFPSEISVSRICLSGHDELCFFVRDTTQRETSEELRRQMHFIISRSRAVAFRMELDADFRTDYISDNVAQYGFEAERFLEGSLSFVNLIHPEDAAACTGGIRSHADEGAEEMETECRILTADREERWIHLQGLYVRDEQGDPLYFQGVFMDISERKHMQAERDLMEIRLRQAQKLESMGQLAAGIAHEINTPTQFTGDSIHYLQASFSDLCELLRRYHLLLDQARGVPSLAAEVADLDACLEETDHEFLTAEIPRALDRSLKGIKRIADIVQAMKEFSHPGSADRALMDVNRAIENAIIVSKNEWKYVAEMETRLEKELPMIRCIPGEINQVILNILVNAAQAIEETLPPNPEKKGRITITTRRQNEYVCIEFQDTGGGMSAGVKSRIFDPFFTTKEVGRGTGQGLTIVYNIVVNRHGGRLWVESEPGSGALFRVLLPVENQQKEEPFGIEGGLA